MDALDATPHSLDYLVQVPHDPLRMAVMGERAAARQISTPEDISAMRDLLREALEAGAAGFSTGRSDNHRTADGHDTPACEASEAELTGIVQAFGGLGRGVVQVSAISTSCAGPSTSIASSTWSKRSRGRAVGRSR